MSIASGGIVGFNCEETNAQKDDAISTSHILSTQVSNLVITKPGG